MSSAHDNPEVVQKYIDCEVEAGRLLPAQGSTTNPIAQIHTSPFGVIPKRHQPEKWRLIVDLSSPPGHSVNGAVSEALCSVHYPSVHDGAMLATALGKGAWLAKLDLKNAYRIIPIHPPSGPLAAGSALGRPDLHRCSPALWPPFSPQNLGSSCRRSHVDYAEAWYPVCYTLSR